MTITNQKIKPDCTLFENANVYFHSKKYKKAEDVMAILIQQETNAEYCYFMSRIKESRGLYVEQLEFLKEALILSPTSSEFLIKIAFTQLRLCNFNEAYRYANITNNIEKNNTEINTLLGNIYHELGQYEQSANAFKSAINTSQCDSELFYRYGTALTLSGKITDSIDAYQQSIAINSSYGLAYAALSKARKATVNESNIEKLKLLVKENRNPWLGITLYHGLAKEFDDLGQYRDAFSALEKGKKRLRTSCPYSPTDGAENIKKLLALYNKQTYKITSSPTASKAAPIFVTGMPRTGTTIVERILTNSSEVLAIGERIQFSALLKQQCQKNYPGLVDAQVLEDSWATIDFDKLGNDYIESVQYITKGQYRFVDKLPLNILLAGVILRALPQAKIICLMRDPLDTIIGNYRQVFEQSSGTYAYTLELNALASFVYEFRRLARSLQQTFGERFMVVDYETLVDEPVAQANKIYKFCQLTWDNSYIDIHKNTAAIGTASAAQVQEPIHKKSLGHAQNYLFCLEKFKIIFQHEQEE